MVRRYDIGTLASPRIMSDGRLVVDAKLTCTGVFPYMNADGTTRYEYRPPSEVFDAKSLSTFPMTSVTNDHPEGMVTTSNATDVTVGIVGTNVRQVGKHVAAELVIFDDKTIKDIESGKLEISCGYEADVEVKEGISPEGVRYDSIQHNILINHVAIVDVGRAGPSARIRMDSADAAQIQNKEKPLEKEFDMDLIQAMKEITDLKVQLFAEAARADKAETDNVINKERADKAEAERDSANDLANKAEASRKDASDGFDAKVAARVKLCFDAKSVIKDSLEGLSDRDIKEKVIKAVTDFDITSEHSDAYVNVRHEMALQQDKSAEESKQQSVTKTDVKEEDDAEQRMLKRLAAIGQK